MPAILPKFYKADAEIFCTSVQSQEQIGVGPQEDRLSLSKLNSIS